MPKMMREQKPTDYLNMRRSCRLRVVPVFLRRNAGARLVFLAWGDFHARPRFARSTVPEEK